MRFATFRRDGAERFGLVLPRNGEDWIYEPAAVERLADSVLGVKGAGSRWYRPRFLENGAWPEDLAGLLGLGEPALDAARRMVGFLERFQEQGDPVLLGRAGLPAVKADLQAPIPRPRLLLGAVGNNAPFVRNDPPRGRNLHQPSCHNRAWTSIVGPGQPIVVPADSEWWHSTTELGVVVGRGGRDIPREQAMDHVAGFTVVNDCASSGFAERWEALDRRHGHQGFHFHSSNTASWLSKTSDTMCAVGPYLVTKDEVGDPYDLMCYLRENGRIRNRSHTGAMMTGIEETIFWLSSFLTLEPGMIIHLGAMGQDGVRVDPDAIGGPSYLIETEIEHVGTLHNPFVALAQNDWRETGDHGRSVHPVPAVRDLIESGRTAIDTWRPADARHFWTLAGNSQGSPVEPRPYPLAYLAPATAMATSGDVILLPARSRTITAGCELGAVIGKLTSAVNETDAPDHILGYVTMIVLRDSSFADSLVAPHFLNANMPELYCRWPDGFNVVSPTAVRTGRPVGRRMRLRLGDEEIIASTDDYLLDAAAAIAALSSDITMLPGDLVALGVCGPSITIPLNVSLDGVLLSASIDGLDGCTATIDDRREGAGE